MKKLKTISFVVAIICLLCSCVKKENEPFDIEKCVSPNININRMFLKKYSQDEIEKIRKFDGTIEELNKEYPIKCVRKYDSDNCYRISYLGENNIVQVWYLANEEKVYPILYKFSCPKKKLEKLKLGTSVEEVQETDPDGDYAFLYVSSDEAPLISEHYTKDGYLITIDYDDDYKITKINEELI